MLIRTLIQEMLFPFLTLVVIVGTSLAAYFKRIRREKVVELESVGQEIRAEFEAELRAIVPHILRRPTTVTSSVEVLSTGFFKAKRYRIVLMVKFSLARDLSTIKPMSGQFVEEYLSRSGNRRYAVKILFSSVSSTTSEVRL